MERVGVMDQKSCPQLHAFVHFRPTFINIRQVPLYVRTTRHSCTATCSKMSVPELRRTVAAAPIAPGQRKLGLEHRRQHPIAPRLDLRRFRIG